MTPDAIDSLERSLAVRLPAPYRETMGSYPFGPESSAAELWLLDDPPRLLQLNRAGAEVWPRGFSLWVPTEAKRHISSTPRHRHSQCLLSAWSLARLSRMLPVFRPF